jgi:hypothetical protein
VVSIPSVIDPVRSAFRDRGFLPVMAGGSMKMAAQQDASAVRASSAASPAIRSAWR